MNVISGFGPTAGAALASHMDVDKVYTLIVFCISSEFSSDEETWASSLNQCSMQLDISNCTCSRIILGSQKLIKFGKLRTRANS